MRARDIMTSDPFVLTPNDPVSQAAEIMRDREVGIIPVVDDEHARHLLGVITDRDIAVRCVAEMHMPACKVSRHMTGEHLQTVKLDDDVAVVIALMKHDQVRRIPVVSDGNRLEGMISQADLATKLGPSQPLAVEKVLEFVSTKGSLAHPDHR